jgi:SAM-dependent methyltransferase
MAQVNEIDHLRDMKLIDRLKLPEISQIEDLDEASATVLHARILQKKVFLKKLYGDFYRELQSQIDQGNTSQVLELGSGGGFIKEIIPNAITSDILPLESVDVVCSACQIPFEDDSLDAIVMIDVLHHIPNARAFFTEAVRCLKPGGRIAMIEPANTVWSQFIYKNFHHETFDPEAGWEFDSKGPLSTANGALPWIVFHRDRDQFENSFPRLKITKTQVHTPLRYVLSGGFTLRQLTPSWSYCMVKGFENLLYPLNRWIGMFETIVLQKHAK